MQKFKFFKGYRLVDTVKASNINEAINSTSKPYDKVYQRVFRTVTMFLLLLACLSSNAQAIKLDTSNPEVVKIDTVDNAVYLNFDKSLKIVKIFDGSKSVNFKVESVFRFLKLDFQDYEIKNRVLELVLVEPDHSYKTVLIDCRSKN